MYDPIRASDAVIQRLRANHPSLIDLTTGRVERLLEALGRPDLRLPPVIHVAGTNGKGSTTAFLRAMAEAAGLTVHVLTSPHLVRFAERIRVAGKLISDSSLEDLTDRLEAVNAGQPISFFEITTVLAFTAFAETPADLCLIEVGLGGRFDATNVFPSPAVSVITPVDYDHLEMLGPELSKIAWEKAGIIKADTPVVCARQRDEAMAVILAEAESLGAPLTLVGRDADIWRERGRLMVQTPDRLLDLPPPALPGPHQFENAGLAALALRALGDPRITDEALGAGAAAATWPGRFQRLKEGPLGRLAVARGSDLWLDGAHNPHGAEALARTCAEMGARDGRPLVLVVGQFARKDPRGFFAAFRDLPLKVVATTFDSPTALSPEALAEAARAEGLTVETAPDVSDAVALALGGEGPAPRVVICGGLHFAGEVLALSPETWPS
jgi:dihydrofolate synthase/folylpolyglutamate synthase